MKRFIAVLKWALVIALTLVVNRHAFCQDIEVNAGSSFHGKGTYNVKGNIDNSADTSAVLTIPGTIALVDTNSAATQTVGTKGKIVVNALVAGGNSSKVLGVPVDVDSALDIANGAGHELRVNGKTLTVKGLATKTSGALKADDSTSSAVVYDGATSQAVIDATYNNLTLSNTGSKSLNGDVTAANLTHAGGALSVNHNLVVTTAGTIATVDSIHTGSSLTVKGAATIDSIAASGGTVAADAGTVTIAKTFVNGGGLVASNGGDLAFKSDLHNNATLTVNPSSKAAFGGLVNGTGSYQFDSLSTVAYDQATGTQAVLPVAYGTLQLKNTKKTLANAVTVKGDLALDSALTLLDTSKSLTMTSPKGKNVTGVGEVIGKVVRTNKFDADTLYTFNGAHIGLALNETINAGSMALTLHPDTVLPNTPSQKYAKRLYTFSGSNLDTAKIFSMSLSYADNELNNILNETKLGIRDFRQIDTTWSKLTNAARTRTNDSSANFVYIDSLFASLSNVSDFALVNVAFGSIKSGSWNLASTWDEGVPSKLDDAEINPSHAITVDSDTSVASVALLDSTASLTINTGSLAVASQVDNYGTLTVGNGTLAKSLTIASHLVNRKKLVVNPNATLSLTGKLKNFGDVTNDGIIDIGQ